MGIKKPTTIEHARQRLGGYAVSDSMDAAENVKRGTRGSRTPDLCFVMPAFVFAVHDRRPISCLSLSNKSTLFWKTFPRIQRLRLDQSWPQ